MELWIIDKLATKSGKWTYVTWLVRVLDCLAWNIYGRLLEQFQDKKSNIKIKFRITGGFRNNLLVIS